MDFTVQSLHNMEKDLNSTLLKLFKDTKTHAVEELNHTILVKLHKDPLADFVEKLAVLLKSNLELCKSAASTIDQMKSEQISDQKKVIGKQQEQLEAVKKTVQTEIKSWTDVVTQNCSNVTTPNELKQAVKSAAADDDRGKTLIIYGEKEEDDEDLHDIVADIMYKLGEKCAVVDKYRVGARKPGVVRPIKVKLPC